MNYIPHFGVPMTGTMPLLEESESIMLRMPAFSTAILSLLLAESCLTTTLLADTVVFKHGTELECKVLGLTPEGWQVTVGNEEKAALTLAPETVKEIAYDYDSRLDEIRAKEKAEGAPLYLEHYNLGLWCEERGTYDARMFDRALSRFLEVQGKPGIPDDVLLHIGRMYEQGSTPDPTAALKAYQDFAAKHAENLEAKAAIARLEKAPASAPSAPSAPAGKTEGLEVRPWGSEKWSTPATIRGILEASNGTQVLEITYPPSKTSEAKVAISNAFKENVASKKSLVLDIYNPEKHAIPVAVAIVTGPNYQWFESKTITAAPGDWTLGARFDLTRDTFWKSEATNWGFRTRPTELNQMRSLIILLFNGNKQGKVYIDAIHFEDAQ